MKVLLDENLPHALRTSLGEHDCSTVSYMGWAGMANGKLLSAAEAAGIQIFLTGDQNLAYQQSMSGRSIAVVALSQIEWPILRKFLPEIIDAMENAAPGSFKFVQCDDSMDK